MIEGQRHSEDLSTIAHRWPRNPMILEALERQLRNLLPSPSLLRRMLAIED